MAEKLSQTLNGIVEFRKKFPRQRTLEKTIVRQQQEILEALNQFMECIRYLNTRRNKNAVITLTNESDVQDALFLMLRLWLQDLKYENPDSKHTNRFTIPDFYIASAQTIVEVKFIRDKHHGKNISKELHDDIEMYRKVPKCSLIIFFIYDPDSLIPSAENLKEDICVQRTYNSLQLDIEIIIKP